METGVGSWRTAIIAGVDDLLAHRRHLHRHRTADADASLGADPATASTIFLTMVTDSLSFLIFLGMASALSGWVGLVG